MKKKPISSTRLYRPKQTPAKPALHRRRSSHDDLFFHAGAFHKAAKAMAASFRPDANALGDFDVFPIVFMYRHAVELYLKAIVLGEGGNFLATTPDRISISKSHSISWLAQFVCQIVTALKWEKEFRCQGVENLTDFKSVVESINSVDPGCYTFRLPFDPQEKASVGEFAGKMDALLDLLSAIADGLAAEWDLQSEEAPLEGGWKSGGGFEPPVQ